MAEPDHPTRLVDIAHPRPDVVRNPDAAREAAQAVLDASRTRAQAVPERGSAYRPFGSLFLPVERATDEFQQLYGRRPSIYEIAAGVASRRDLVDPVSPSVLLWRRPIAPGLTDSWFFSESVGDQPRLDLERAAIAGALLECLADWEEQVMRSRVETRMTQAERTHTLAFSQMRACIALARGIECLGVEIAERTD
jgi:hypothetical protein